MKKPDQTNRQQTIDRLLWSPYSELQTKRFPFDGGEVVLVYTIGTHPQSGNQCPIVRVLTIFPSRYEGATHHHGVVHRNVPVTNAVEASLFISQFNADDLSGWIEKSTETYMKPFE